MWANGEMCICVFICLCVCVCSVRPELYLTVTPSFSSTRTPFSWYSSRVSQKLSLSFMMSASTAPPRNTMCFRLGGSSIRILNFCETRGGHGGAISSWCSWMFPQWRSPYRWKTSFHQNSTSRKKRMGLNSDLSQWEDTPWKKMPSLLETVALLSVIPKIYVSSWDQDQDKLHKMSYRLS